MSLGEKLTPRTLAGVTVLLLLFSFLVAINFGLLHIYVVISESMVPTLQVGDRILVDRDAPFDRFSIICFQDPTRRNDPNEQLVKRIVGLGGDEIEISDGALFVNGKEQLSAQVTSDVINWPNVRVKVPYGHVFVLGDNRNNSFDSLNFGPVDETDITGVLTLILWPPGRWGRVASFRVEGAGPDPDG